MAAEEQKAKKLKIEVDFDNQQTKKGDDQYKPWGNPPSGSTVDPTTRCLPATTSKSGHTGHDHKHLWVGFWLDYADIPFAPYNTVSPEC